MINGLENKEIDKLLDGVSQKLQDTSLSCQINNNNSTNLNMGNHKDNQVGSGINSYININQIEYDNIFDGDMEMINQNQSSINKKQNGIRLSELKNASILVKKNNSFQKEEFLKPIDWKVRNNDNFVQIEQKFNAILSSIDKASLYRLCSSVKNCTLEQAPDYPNIGPLSTLEFLVENQFISDKNQIEQISLHIVELEDHVFRWRNTKGDGNCFYRSVIFSFLEHIIMSNDICLLKEIIIEINDKFSDKYTNAEYLPFIKTEIAKIDKNLVIKLLILIEEAMDNPHSQLTPYEILMKSFLFGPKFDIGMIFYLRFILFEFIKENFNKVYSPEFSVKLGNLLPLNYETEFGDFLFDQFYKEDLLIMGTEAEKIVIYLTPFVLRCDLNVIIYEFDSNEAVTPMKFPSFLDNKPKIDILYRKMHYDIIYNKQYYNKHANDISYFLNLHENQRIVKEEYLVSAREFKRKPTELNDRVNSIRPEDDINHHIDSVKEDILPQCSICCLTYTHMQNILNICSKCLTNEIENQIFNCYVQYLHQAKQTWNQSRTSFFKLFNILFRKQQCTVSNQKLSQSSAAEIAGRSLNDIVNTIKIKLCVHCLNNINPNGIMYYIAPCGCFLCSKKCFEEYFNLYLVSEYSISKETRNYSQLLDSCICGYQYNNDDYMSLYTFFNEKDFKKFRKTLKEVIMKKFRQCCSMCLLNNCKNYYLLTLKDIIISDVFKEKEFNHVVCNNCFGSIGKEKNVQCLLCNRMHQITKAKQLDVESEKEDCLII